MIKKKTLVLLLMIVSTGTAFSQFDYMKDVYTAADMNIKGKVKRVTETHVYTNKKGKTDENEEKWKFVYEFDESGRLIKQEYTDLKEDEVQTTFTYEYMNDRLSKVNVKRKYQYPTTNSFQYSSSAITVKDESGNTIEIHALSNGRVSEIYNGSSKTSYKFRNVYEYNSLGQIIKKMYKDDAEQYRKYYHTEKYEYNKQGDVSKMEKYNNDGKLDNTNSYEFKYDKNNNWTKCTGVEYSPGDDADDKIYETYTRSYEFY